MKKEKDGSLSQYSAPEGETFSFLDPEEGKEKEQDFQLVLSTTTAFIKGEYMMLFKDKAYACF